MNINQNSESHFDFLFEYGNTAEDIIALKTTDFQNHKPGRFHIWYHDQWDHTILGAFIEVLYYFKERGIEWEKFQLNFKASDQIYTSPLIQMVNGLNLFKKMILDLAFYDDDEYSADCDYLFPGIMNNKRLEELQVVFPRDNAPDSRRLRIRRATF